MMHIIIYINNMSKKWNGILLSDFSMLKNAILYIHVLLYVTVRTCILYPIYVSEFCTTRLHVHVLVKHLIYPYICISNQHDIFK